MSSVLLFLAQILSRTLGAASLIAADSATRPLDTVPPRINPFYVLEQKLESGQPVRVAFVGGSITAGSTTSPLAGTNRDGAAYDYSQYLVENDSWRALVFRWLRVNYQQSRGQLQEINAGLGGTGSEFGAYRFATDVLIHDPDLIFIEFAVNDIDRADSSDDPESAGSIQRCILSMVRRARARNPDVAICMPISSVRDYANGTLMQSAWHARHDKARRHHLRIAEALGIPPVDVSLAAMDPELLAGTDPRVIFDGPEDPGNALHPSPPGHALYARAVQAVLVRAFMPRALPATRVHLPFPPYPVRPELVSANGLGAPQGWSLDLNQENVLLEPLFEDRQALFANGPGSTLDFVFNGSAVSLWWERDFGLMPMNGLVRLYLDGIYLGDFSPSDPEDPIRRYFPVTRSLDPGQVHWLSVELPWAQPSLPVRMALLGICVDQGS